MVWAWQSSAPGIVVRTTAAAVASPRLSLVAVPTIAVPTGVLGLIAIVLVVGVALLATTTAVASSSASATTTHVAGRLRGVEILAERKVVLLVLLGQDLELES